MSWKAHDLPNRDWQLWTRGGTHAVYIQKRGTEEKIELPSELLRLLVADDIRCGKIDKIEQMGTEELLQSLI